MEFEWDDDKNRNNHRKHRIDFETARHVFDDANVLELDDPEPSEERFNSIGMVEGRLIHVTYTMRDDRCRIISARGAEPHEGRLYHNV